MQGFKSKLKSVLADAVSNFQDSGDPNDACIKAANAAGFNCDQADRLVETFNTARVICNYKSADDKAGSCSLADKSVVHAGIVRPEASEKCAAYDEGVIFGYDAPDTDHFTRAGKEAEFSVDLVEARPSRESLDRTALRDISSLRQLAKTAAEEARAARDLARERVVKLASAISRSASLDEVHDNVACLARAYACDDRYSPALEKLAELLPAASEPDSSVFSRYDRMHVVDTARVDGFVPALKEASDLLAGAAALEAFSDETMTEAAFKEAELVSSVKRAADPAMTPPASTSDVRDTLLESYKNDFESRKRKAVNEVSNLKRKLILQDLLLRDRILSQEDPRSVVDVYKSIHQLSPDLTLNRDVLRSMLRQAVQSVAISPYDAKTLSELDEARHKAYTVM